MSNFSSPSRVNAGVPTGGQFAAQAHAESDVVLAAATAAPVDAQEVTVGVDPQPITLAQARRDLPEGQRVQVVYLGGQHRGDTDEPDVRTVTKQTSSEMITTGAPGTRAQDGSHLDWAKPKAQRDDAGNVLISDASGVPIAAYIPLPPGSAGSEFRVNLQAARDLGRSKESSDTSELQTLAGSDVPEVRRRVADNPAAGSFTLYNLASDDDPKVALAVASNPRTSWQSLAQVEGNNTDREVRYAVATHPVVAMSTLSKLSTDHHLMVRSAVARHPNSTPELLHAMAARERDADVLGSLARNPNTPPSDLEGMSRGNGHVMSAVALNPSTPVETLRELSFNTSTGNQVRSQMAANPSTPADVLARLAGETDSWVRQHSAKNPRLPSQVHQSLSNDPDPKVRREAAGNPSASPAALSRLSREEDSFIRRAVASNQRTPVSDLSRLSHEEDRQIRRMVASNPRTPASDLARLAGDESHVVRVRVAANSSTDPQVLRRLSEEDGVVGVAALRTIQEQG